MKYFRIIFFKILRRYIFFFKKKSINKSVINIPSIISNNCIGGIIYNDLKLRFSSPTINLFFFAPDYIRFLENLNFYLSQKISFSFTSKYFDHKVNYPVGILFDIEIHFLHYDDYQHAENEWYKRVARVNHDNLFIIGSDRDLSNAELRIRFANLPFKKKIFFSSKPINFSHEFFFDEYFNSESVGDLIADDKAWYFYFDVVHWLNTGKIKRTFFIKFIFNKYRSVKLKVLGKNF